MSAYVVDRAHIDALVTAAVRGFSGVDVAPDSRGGYGLRWYVSDPQDIDAESHEDYFRRLADITREARHEDADRVGAMLWAENVRSVQHRYPDTIDSGVYPGPIDFGAGDALDYAWRLSSPMHSAAVILAALDGYEYQSCEHRDWQSSEARTFCDALRRKACGVLADYETGWNLAGATR